MGTNPLMNNPQDEPFTDGSSHLSSQPGGLLSGNGPLGAQGLAGGLVNQSSNPVQGNGFQSAASDLNPSDLASGFNFGGTNGGGMFGGENPFQKSFKQSMML